MSKKERHTGYSFMETITELAKQKCKSGSRVMSVVQDYQALLLDTSITETVEKLDFNLVFAPGLEYSDDYRFRWGIDEWATDLAGIKLDFQSLSNAMRRLRGYAQSVIVISEGLWTYVAGGAMFTHFLEEGFSTMIENEFRGKQLEASLSGKMTEESRLSIAKWQELSLGIAYPSFPSVRGGNHLKTSLSEKAAALGLLLAILASQSHEKGFNDRIVYITTLPHSIARIKCHWAATIPLPRLLSSVFMEVARPYTTNPLEMYRDDPFDEFSRQVIANPIAYDLSPKIADALSDIMENRVWNPDIDDALYQGVSYYPGVERRAVNGIDWQEDESYACGNNKCALINFASDYQAIASMGGLKARERKKTIIEKSAR